MAGPAPTFDEALEVIDGVDGWLTAAQARQLFDAASRVPDGGRIVEIGSFHGRSTSNLPLPFSAVKYAPGVPLSLCFDTSAWSPLIASHATTAITVLLWSSSSAAASATS